MSADRRDFLKLLSTAQLPQPFPHSSPAPLQFRPITVRAPRPLTAGTKWRCRSFPTSLILMAWDEWGRRRR